MHVQNLMNSLWDIRIFLGLVPKESLCTRVHNDRQAQSNKWSENWKGKKTEVWGQLSRLVTLYSPRILHGLHRGLILTSGRQYWQPNLLHSQLTDYVINITVHNDSSKSDIRTVSEEIVCFLFQLNVHFCVHRSMCQINPIANLALLFP